MTNGCPKIIQLYNSSSGIGKELTQQVSAVPLCSAAQQWQYLQVHDARQLQMFTFEGSLVSLDAKMSFILNALACRPRIQDSSPQPILTSIPSSRPHHCTRDPGCREWCESRALKVPGLPSRGSTETKASGLAALEAARPKWQ